MSLYLIAGPTTSPVSLSDMKMHLRVEHTDEDDHIEGLIVAMVQHLDGRDGLMGRALIDQTWELRISEFRGCEISIPLPPLIEVISVTYYDADDVLQTLSPDEYEVVGIGGFDKGRVVLKYGRRWPATSKSSEAVIVRFRAGYLTTDSPPVANVPAPIVVAIRRQVATMFENRDDAALSALGVKISGPVQAMLAPYRIHG